MLLSLLLPSLPSPTIQHDLAHKTIRVRDESGHLKLTIDYSRGCVVKDIEVMGVHVGSASTGLSLNGTWRGSPSLAKVPSVEVTKDRVFITGIQFGDPGMHEQWTFGPEKEGIRWWIDRGYWATAKADYTDTPRFSFTNMTTWDGALLDSGGVAWCKLFDQPNATYALEGRRASFWSQSKNLGLEIKADEYDGRHSGLKFSRQPDKSFTLDFSPCETSRSFTHGQSRFLKNSQNVWAPTMVDPSQPEHAMLTLSASRNPTLDRGDFRGLNGGAISQILNTIARIGVIDNHIVGSNGWYSGYAVLHEPWFALMALAVDDRSYFAALTRSLENDRLNAVLPDGMVKSRWAYTPGDEIPGTYDKNGFYECQWGRLMDSQPCYVINVAEHAEITGDGQFLANQQKTCESALDYILRRDTDGNGLFEMEADSRNQHKSSDWLDVVWASYESAFVNAQLYRALTLWSQAEFELGNVAKSKYYLSKAIALKTAFNKPTTEGGFWDAKNKWYVYWREKDGSVHGNNLTLPVNFMAIGYGVCDDPARIKAVLDQTEQYMQEQKLFCWPVNIFPYSADETNNQPFPTYENGDIFLAWAELGIRAYANYKPEIAVKYLKNVLLQYEKDGLAFQRYLRKSQTGAGDDILANNCSAVVGLYRDIYGIQPRRGHLYLDPHLTPELDGTVVNYGMGGTKYKITLSDEWYRVNAGDATVSAYKPLGVKLSKGLMEFCNRANARPDLTIKTASTERLQLEIRSWNWSRKVWLFNFGRSRQVTAKVQNLAPNSVFTLVVGEKSRRVRSSAQGEFAFSDFLKGGSIGRFEILGG